MDSIDIKRFSFTPITPITSILTITKNGFKYQFSGYTVNTTNDIGKVILINEWCDNNNFKLIK